MSQESELLAKQSLLNRALYQQRAIASAETPDNQATQYLGYDSATGRGKLKNLTGSEFYGQSITNGVIGIGDSVRMRGNKYDTMPYRNPIPDIKKPSPKRW